MPRTTKHRVVAEIEHVIDDDNIAYPTVQIEYTYYPGAPAYTPRGEHAPTDPPEPASIEFISAKLIDAAGLTPTTEQVDGWADKWLNGDGYNWAVGSALADLDYEQ